jgi:hypothetical protein
MFVSIQNIISNSSPKWGKKQGSFCLYISSADPQLHPMVSYLKRHHLHYLPLGSFNQDLRVPSSSKKVRN